MINFNELFEKLTSQLEAAEKILTDAATKLSLVRKKEADKLCRAVSASLKELNFILLYLSFLLPAYLNHLVIN